MGIVEKDFSGVSLPVVIRTLYGYALLLVICLVLLPFFPVLLLFSLFDKNKRIASAFLFGASFLFQALFAGFSVRIEGESVKPPKKGERRIYVVNHASRIDGVLFCNIPGRIKTIMKASDAKIPVLGWLIVLTGHILVGKESSVASKTQLYQDILEVIERGDSLLIFPEGTRSRDGEVGPFHHGGFKIALKTGADIYPVVFDTWNVIKPGSFLIRNMRPVVKFLKPIEYKRAKQMSYIELSNCVRKQLETELHRVRKKGQY